MQSVSSRIWTHVTVSISYDDNHYTTGTSIEYSVTVAQLAGVVEYTDCASAEETTPNESPGYDTK